MSEQKRSLSSEMFHMLGTLVDTHGEELFDVKEKFNAGDAELSVSADHKEKGYRFRLSMSVEDIKDDD